MPLRNSDIVCRSQQTRFDPLQGGVSALKRELDLKDVSISIGNREILSDAHIKLNAGVRYVLHARNGQGKSTILRAISERLIPGIPLDLRIACLQQRDEDAGSSLAPSCDVEGTGPGGGWAGQAETPGQLVFRSDTDMVSALRKRDRESDSSAIRLAPCRIQTDARAQVCKLPSMTLTTQKLRPGSFASFDTRAR